MTQPYLAHFALNEAPFTKEVPDGELWLPSSKLAVVDALLEALDEHASVVLVGEPGVGKTCVLRALRHRIPAAGFRLTYCHNATLGRRDFYRQLCQAVGLSPVAAERVHPVFLLDEAHLMHQDTLDHLHILLNYAWDSRALLSLILVGLPELRERLALRHNRSLYSRIHHRLEVTALTPDDTAEYLRLRLHRVGCDREVFATDAVVLLHEATLGAMRDLDRLAAHTLRETARKKRKLVERDVAARVIEADTRERDR
jgi:general secretion pathway protein A